MDRETRFLIVSKLTKDRSAINTTEAFEEAARNAHGIKPETVFTNSLRHYNIAVKTTFPDAKRIVNYGIAHSNHIVSKIIFVRRPKTSLRKMKRTLKPGGHVHSLQPAP